MSQAFAHQLGLKIWKTNVGAWKIDGITLETYGMVVFTFSMLDKDGRKGFFEKNFLLADVKPNIVLRMLYLTVVMLTLIIKLGTDNGGPTLLETYFQLPDESNQ